MRNFIFLILLIFKFGILEASCDCRTLLASLGPEIYFFERERTGGTKQSGCMDGVRLEVERIKGSSFYLGGDFFYSEGVIKGHNSRNLSLRSRIHDWTVEGRLGFTFMLPIKGYPYIVPFGGYGHFEEHNKFLFPSPLLYKTTDTFHYITTGLLSGVNFTPQFSLGINIKTRFMVNGSSKITEDSDFENITLSMNDESQYRVEVPLSYVIADCCFSLDLILTPFYEYRHFGGKEGYPFNFIETKFNLLGMRFAIGMRY